MADEHNKAVQLAMMDEGKEDIRYELCENAPVAQGAQDPVYDQDEEEPQLHARTWIALAAFFLLNYVQVLALQSPSSVVSIALLRQCLHLFLLRSQS